MGNAPSHLEWDPLVPTKPKDTKHALLRVLHHQMQLEARLSSMSDLYNEVVKREDSVACPSDVPGDESEEESAAAEAKTQSKSPVHEEGKTESTGAMPTHRQPTAAAATTKPTAALGAAAKALEREVDEKAMGEPEEMEAVVSTTLTARATRAKEVVKKYIMLNDFVARAVNAAARNFALANHLKHATGPKSGKKKPIEVLEIEEQKAAMRTALARRLVSFDRICALIHWLLEDLDIAEKSFELATLEDIPVHDDAVRARIASLRASLADAETKLEESSLCLGLRYLSDAPEEALLPKDASGMPVEVWCMLATNGKTITRENLFQVIQSKRACVAKMSDEVRMHMQERTDLQSQIAALDPDTASDKLVPLEEALLKVNSSISKLDKQVAVDSELLAFIIDYFSARTVFNRLDVEDMSLDSQTQLMSLLSNLRAKMDEDPSDISLSENEELRLVHRRAVFERDHMPRLKKMMAEEREHPLCKSRIGTIGDPRRQLVD